jgi:tetratricopeptide (TPR) repeat protein
LEAALQARGAEAVSAAAGPVEAVAVTAAEAGALAPLEQAGWAQEKSQMETQLRELREASARDTERLQQMTQELEQVRQASAGLTEQVKTLEGRKIDIRESDLYKEQEQANAILREKMLEVEADRQRLSAAAEATAKRDAEQTQVISTETQARTTAETSLTEALAREGEYKELIERLVPQVAELEKQVTSLVQEREDLTSRLRERDEDLSSLKVELERREHRLAKAERVAEVLEKARTEVVQAGDREKLNMHYNMASVYARESKFAEAENEYLQALRIDPTDADVHYNLGILYDDELKQPEKAAVHYRRYLQLTPHGPDADRVRNWLMKLEMNTQR